MTRKNVPLLTIMFLACLVSGAAAVSSHTQVNGSMNSGTGINIASNRNKATVSLGESIVGASSSALYKSSLGFLPSANASSSLFVSSNLDGVFVYPNPYKPLSGGIYDSDKITFKKLPTRATIKIFNIALEHIATLEKDSSTDEYKWTPLNDSGATVASGLYLYFISDLDGHKAKGKFVIIR
jgi:hypothetical protein